MLLSEQMLVNVRDYTVASHADLRSQYHSDVLSDARQSAVQTSSTGNWTRRLSIRTLRKRSNV